MNADGRCPRSKCRHSMTGYHVGSEWCAICARNGGPCAGEPSLPAQRSAGGTQPITEGANHDR